MLVLSRKSQESIVIDGKIEVTVLSVEGDIVKLGISAPKEVSIFRKELYEAIQVSNQEAAEVNVSLKQLSQLLREKGNGNM
jgi:carbon storage regulator